MNIIYKWPISSPWMDLLEPCLHLLDPPSRPIGTVSQGPQPVMFLLLQKVQFTLWLCQNSY